MPKRKSNPINWAKHAWWHEAEGTKRRPPKPSERFYPLTTISQDLARKEIVEKLCGELKQAGFTSRMRIKNRDAMCEIDRLEEQKCFIQQTNPHYLAQETQRWAREYLDALERPPPKEKPGRPRKRFQCPTETTTQP